MLTSLAAGRDISGQVFIVTRGGESVKLGLVTVTAYDADQVAAVVKEADEKTSAERSQLQRVEEAADAAYKRFSDSRGSDHGKWLDALNLEEKAQRRRAYLTSSFYYSKSFPPELASVKSDADGHFRVSVPDGKPITLRAWSTRELSDSVECYDWFVRVPDATVEINLSNDNQLNRDSAAALLGDKYTTEQIAAEAEKLADNISMRTTRSMPLAGLTGRELGSKTLCADRQICGGISVQAKRRKIVGSVSLRRFNASTSILVGCAGIWIARSLWPALTANF